MVIKDKLRCAAPRATEREPYRVRLPGFIRDEDVGLGDVVKRTTYMLGLRPCEGCERRAQTLNSWFAFSNRRPK